MLTCAWLKTSSMRRTVAGETPSRQKPEQSLYVIPIHGVAGVHRLIRSGTGHTAGRAPPERIAVLDVVDEARAVHQLGRDHE